MKKIIIASICLMMITVTAFSQTEKKTTLFNDLKTLRFQYRTSEFSLSTTQKFGEAGKYELQRADLQKMKSRIDNLDKEYVKLLSKDELAEYNIWKSNEDSKDKSPDLGWWFTAFNKGGC